MRCELAKGDEHLALSPASCPPPVRARINSRSNSAKPASTVSISLPWELVVSAQISLSDFEPAPRCVIASNDIEKISDGSHQYVKARDTRTPPASSLAMTLGQFYAIALGPLAFFRSRPCSPQPSALRSAQQSPDLASKPEHPTHHHLVSLHIRPTFAVAKVYARLADLGATVMAGSITDVSALFAGETEKWRNAIKFSGAKSN